MNQCDLRQGVDFWLDRHLQTWAAWMRRDSLRLGLPKKAAVGENYTSLDLDNEIAYDSLDDDTAVRVNAVIDDVGQRHPAQKAAIYRDTGLIAVFRFPRDNYADTLDAARQNVLIGLRRRGVWCGE